MKTIPTKTTWLEMRSPPPYAAAGAEAVLKAWPGESIAVRRATAPSVQGYRALYNGVGAEYRWVDRNLMLDAELQAILSDDRVEVWVLESDGQAAGYAELDRRQEGEIELAYFGLFPAWLGQGWGKRFLAWAVARAWSYGPRRVWVHTCDLDHPAALPTYLQAGFTPYQESVIQQPLAD